MSIDRQDFDSQNPIPSFQSLGLKESLLRALAEEGYEVPTPIQVAAIPELLVGRDLMGTAQTGTGKTAAFSLPMLQRLSERQPHGDGRDGGGRNANGRNGGGRNGNRRGRNGNGRNRKGGGKGIRALILAPTRELALQIDASFRAYGRHLPLRTAVVLGGVPMRVQRTALSKKPDILVATPGRLLDLIGQGCIKLANVEMLVLDEADRMLDMGFIHDVREIVNMTPKDRQTMLFSATLTQAIAELASDMLRDPVYVDVSPETKVVGKIDQKVFFVRRDHKLALLSTILRDGSMGRTLVFTRTKHKADRVMRSLVQDGIRTDSIHSNKTQKARERALAGFERGKIQVLVATDIVARGIDVEGISHVINYELPNDAESYVHRIGRTARAGADGVAYSFCDAEDLPLLRAIEKGTAKPLDAHEDHPFHSETIGSLRNRSSSTRRMGGGRRRFGSKRRRMFR